MTLSTSPVDGETGELHGVVYKYNAPKNLWERDALVASNAPGSIDSTDLAIGAVEPTNLNLAVTAATAPPASPGVGPLYLITAPATGAWAGKENQLATWDGAAWVYTTPMQGMLAWDGASLLAWNGTAWAKANLFVLPDRLENSEAVTDANTITLKGTYFVPASATNNAPTNGQYVIEHFPITGATQSYDVQWATLIDGVSSEATHMTYFRENVGGTSWGPWFRENMTQAEMDARYARATAGTSSVSGANVTFNVLDRDLSTPPASPAIGSTYIVKATGVGAWAGHDGEFASWNGTTWDFYPFNEGKIAWIADENVLLIHDGSAPTVYPPSAAAIAATAGNYVVWESWSLNGAGGITLEPSGIFTSNPRLNLPQRLAGTFTWSGQTVTFPFSSALPHANYTLSASSTSNELITNATRTTTSVSITYANVIALPVGFFLSIQG